MKIEISSHVTCKLEIPKGNDCSFTIDKFWLSLIKLYIHDI